MVSNWKRCQTSPREQPWHLQSRDPHQNRHGHRGDGETWQGVEEQHRLPNQVQPIEISGVLHHDIRVRGMNTGGKYKEANQMKFTRKLLFLCYLEHSTNECVRRRVESLVGPREPLRAIVKRWKMIWFGQVTRLYSLCKLSRREGTIDCICKWGRKTKELDQQRHRMDSHTHGHAKHLGECCVESLAWAWGGGVTSA